MSAKVRSRGVKRQEKHPRRKIPLALGQTEKNPTSAYFKIFGQNCFLFFLVSWIISFLIKYPEFLNLLIQCVEFEFFQSNTLGEKGSFLYGRSFLFL